MINEESLTQVSAHHQNSQVVRPAYDSYCFARIPETIKHLLGAPATAPLPNPALPSWEGYEQVVFFFIDAFGWQFFERFADHPFLRFVDQQGTISMMTSMFPSTTAAHITCAHTGLPVAESGVYEWFYYDPLVGDVITPLMFSLAGDKVNGKDIREGLASMGYQPAQLFPDATLYQALASVGVKPYVFTFREYASSSFSRHTNRGAEIIPYSYWPEALVNLSRLLEKPQGRRYFFLYYAAADSLMHQYGPHAPQVEAEILAWLDQMQRFITRLKSRRTLLLLSADHGQAETDPATSLAINLAFPKMGLTNFMDWLQRSPSGAPIRFGGSPRDLFLYIQDEFLSEAQQRIQAALGERAQVKTSAELVQERFFGPTPMHERLKQRLGNLVILPSYGEAMFWFEKDRFEQRFYGHHGGLSPQEMFIPLMALPIDR